MLRRMLKKLYSFILLVISNKSGDMELPFSFDKTSEVIIDKKIYIVERHFIGKRNLQQAVFEMIINETKRGFSDETDKED